AGGSPCSGWSTQRISRTPTRASYWLVATVRGKFLGRRSDLRLVRGGRGAAPPNHPGAARGLGEAGHALVDRGGLATEGSIALGDGFDEFDSRARGAHEADQGADVGLGHTIGRNVIGMRE